MNRRSLIFLSPGVVAIHKEPLPHPGPQQILVETLLSAVSAGTELLLYRGQMPAGIALDETIESLSGTTAYPLKYGYAAVGRVIDTGSELAGSWTGRLVFAFNPHESHFVANTSDVLPLPDDISPEAAIFLPNMETAVSFVMDGRPVIGEQVAVLGQGVVGLLTTALLAELSLASLVTMDTLSFRREWSKRLGAEVSLDPKDPHALAQALARLKGGRDYEGADLVFEVSGRPEALETAIELAGYDGRVLVGSWYGDKRASLDLGGRFHRSHVRIFSSQVSRLAPEWSGRWTKGRRFDVAWEMIRASQPQRLITHTFPFEQAAEAYRQLDQDPSAMLQVVLSYP